MQHNTEISMTISVLPLSPLCHLSILTPTTMMLMSNIMRFVKRMVKKRGCEGKDDIKVLNGVDVSVTGASPDMIASPTSESSDTEE